MILRPIENEEQRTALQRIAGDAIDIYLVAEGTLRFIVVHGTSLVAQMKENHRLHEADIVTLGRAALAALAVGSTLKNSERIGLLVDGTDGGGFSVDVDGAGHVRGYLRESSAAFMVDDELKPGTLSVLRYPEGDTHPFHGQIAVSGGTIDENVERYFTVSEQTPTIFRSSVIDDGIVRGASAVIVQELPEAAPDTLQELAEVVSRTNPARHFAERGTAPTLLSPDFDPWKPRFAGTRPAEFFCPCSHARFGRFLAALPTDEQRDILENGPIPLVTVCHNCNSVYTFERKELEILFSQRER